MSAEGGPKGWGGAMYEVAGSMEFHDDTPVDEFLLDTVFEKTNTIHAHWSENAGVKCSKRSMRSTSVGDFILIGGDFYFVDFAGSKRLLRRNNMARKTPAKILELMNDQQSIMRHVDEVYGYFEHEELGDDCGGGLWFEKKRLVGADGTSSVPKSVIKGIRQLGYIVPREFE